MNVLIRTWLVAALLAAVLSGQSPTPKEALARAQLLETKEHDAAAAEQAYRTLLSDPIAADVAGVAAMRLGALLWRLDRRDEATTFLQSAISIGDEYGGDRAAADQARLILQGQGNDAKLAQERLTKARALVALFAELKRGTRNDKDVLVDDPDGTRSRTVTNDLRALGAQAAEAIASYIEVGVAEHTIAKYPEADPVRGTLLSLLWQIGTEPAAVALRRWSERNDVALRRAVASGAAQVRVAADLEPVLFQYLRDPEPSDEVWRLAASSVEQLRPERWLELLASTDAPLRAAGLSALAKGWRGREREQQEEIVTKHAAAIRGATRDSDPRVAKAAWRVLCSFATGPASATLVYFAEADRDPNESSIRKDWIDVVGDDAWLHALTEAARRVAASPGTSAGTTLPFLVNKTKHTWGRAGVDDVIALLGIGPQYSGAWTLRALPLADDAQLVALIALLPRVGDESWITALTQRPVPAAAFPALRTVIEQDLGGARMPWDNQPTPVNRVVHGRTVTIEGVSNGTGNLLWCAGRTGSPDAATWLGDLVARHPRTATLCVRLLATMTQGDARTAACASLRKLLVWEGTEQNELQPDERSIVFAALARSGDVAAIPLFVRAYELGLARTNSMSWMSGPEASQFANLFAAGIGFLGEARTGGSRLDRKPWHGYGDADLVRAWTTLLDSPMLSRVLGDFSGRIDPATGEVGSVRGASPSSRAPLAVLAVVCERLPKMLGAVADPEAKHDIVANAVWTTVSVLSPSDVRDHPEPRRALAAVFHSEDPEIAYVFVSLDRGTVPEFAAEGRAVLRRLGNPGVLRKLMDAGVELGADDWNAALAAQPSMRVAALESMPAAAGASTRTAVDANLTHADASVRNAAVAAVQRLYGRDGVASLLPLLQDPQSGVREQARKALEALREDAEQRTFWANAGSGIDTSPRGAASKLLAQAKAGEPKEQRVLAIRSLAVLGAAESLPYLIDATKDKDADVATAAREAIAAIHTKSAAPVPANK